MTKENLMDAIIYRFGFEHKITVLACSLIERLPAILFAKSALF